ncbi:MAG: hypothetical protein ACF788_11780, partial [Novipirellula sp. JB048]
ELAVVDYEGPPLPVRAETLSGHDTVHVKLLDPQVISESGTLRLEVSCSPQSEIGVFTSKLRISSVVDHPKMGLLSYIVNVHGDFAPAVSVSPEVLVLSDDQYGPPQIRISSLVGGLESLQVTRSGAASLSFRPHVTGDSGQVRLTLNDIQYSGEEAAYVVLKLAGGKEKISIPVHSLGSVGP